MPTYIVFSEKDKITDDKKKMIAERITDTHSKVTGAPKYYVSVLFKDLDIDMAYRGGKKREEGLFLLGLVRKRSEEDNAKLCESQANNIIELVDVDPLSVWCYLMDISPGGAFDFGGIIPGAGEEDKWYEKLPDSTKKYIGNL